MTNLEAAALISKLYAEHARQEFSAVNKYAEAVTLAIMALKTEEEDNETD